MIPIKSSNSAYYITTEESKKENCRWSQTHLFSASISTPTDVDADIVE
jgi:hypothetical protein